MGRPRRRWEDNIKIDLQELGWVEWIVLTQVQMAGCFECGAENSGSIKIQGISLPDEDLLAAEEGLCCKVLFIWLVDCFR